MKKNTFVYCFCILLFLVGNGSYAQEVKFAMMPIHIEYYAGMDIYAMMGMPSDNKIEGELAEKFIKLYNPMIYKMTNEQFKLYNVKVKNIMTDQLSKEERTSEQDFYRNTLSEFSFFSVKHSRALFKSKPIEHFNPQMPVFANQFADLSASDYLLYFRVMFNHTGNTEGKLPDYAQGYLNLEGYMINGNSGEILFIKKISVQKKNAQDLVSSVMKKNYYGVNGKIKENTMEKKIRKMTSYITKNMIRMAQSGQYRKMSFN